MSATEEEIQDGLVSDAHQEVMNLLNSDYCPPMIQDSLMYFTKGIWEVEGVVSAKYITRRLYQLVKEMEVEKVGYGKWKNLRDACAVLAGAYQREKRKEPAPEPVTKKEYWDAQLEYEVWANNLKAIPLQEKMLAEQKEFTLEKMRHLKGIILNYKGPVA